MSNFQFAKIQSFFQLDKLFFKHPSSLSAIVQTTYSETFLYISVIHIAASYSRRFKKCAVVSAAIGEKTGRAAGWRQKTISRLPQRISGTVQVVKTRFGRSLSYHLKPMVTKPVTKEGMVSLILIPLPKSSMKKLSEELTEEKSNAT